jgi:hypothetical protein
VRADILDREVPTFPQASAGRDIADEDGHAVALERSGDARLDVAESVVEKGCARHARVPRDLRQLLLRAAGPEPQRPEDRK